jgi:hypothetical protein
MQMTRSSTKRESWRLVYGLGKFRVPKQQERALAEVIPDGITPMLNVTFLTRTFASFRVIAEYFRSNSGLGCSAFLGISFPNIAA